MHSVLSAVSSYSLGSGWLAAVFLLSLRLGALFLMTPLLAAASVPTMVRLCLTVSLAVALSLGLPSANVDELVTLADHPGALIQAGITELVLGATLAVGIHLAFAAFSIAGRLLDVQIGFGLAQVFDPATKAKLPILTTAFNQIGVLVFFLVNGHLALMRAIAYSIERFPLGQPWPIEAALSPYLKQIFGLFAVSFSLAAPVVFCVLLVEMALSVLARNLPQLHMFAVGIPIKIVVGVLALSLWFSGVGSVMNRVYAGIYTTWDAFFAVGSHVDMPRSQ